MAGVRLYVYLECTPTPTWDPDGALWFDTERIRGLSRLTLDRDRAKSGEYVELAEQAAKQAAKQIEDEGNREYFEGELATVSDCADSCTL